jgi:hypothetical protein
MEAGGVSDPFETDELLADLTPPQREAVSRTEGPLLILAAAGSGKTRVITRRIAHLIRMGVPAWSILALTFTNKAAGEMRQRVQALIGDGRQSRGLTVSTFHALCARLLRKYAEVAELPGLKPDFAIYATDDQMSLLKRVIADLGISTSNWPPRSVLSAISNAKNELLTAEAYAQRAGDYYSRSIAKIYTAYEKALRTAGALDFDDLLLMTATMLERSREVREDCHRRWQYLMIDEYQDTNRAQFKIASLLIGTPAPLPGIEEDEGTPTGPNVCVVGDPEHPRFRGALPERGRRHARRELPLHSAHPCARRHTDPKQQKAQAQGPLHEQPGGRATDRAHHARRTARGRARHRLPEAHATRGRRAPRLARHGDLLPNQRPLTRHGGRAPGRRNPLHHRPRHILLRTRRG